MMDAWAKFHIAEQENEKLALRIGKSMLSVVAHASNPPP
jgi:hypothetical protein